MLFICKIMLIRPIFIESKEYNEKKKLGKCFFNQGSNCSTHELNSAPWRPNMIIPEISVNLLIKIFTRGARVKICFHILYPK